MQMRVASAISTGLHAAVLLWALVSFSGKTVRGHAGGIAAGRPGEREGLLPDDPGRQEGAQAGNAETAGREEGRSEAGRGSGPQGHRETRGQGHGAENAGAATASQSPTRSPRNSKSRTSRSRPRPSRSRCRRKSRSASSPNSTPIRLLRCSTSAIRSVRPRRVRNSIRRRRSAPWPRHRRSRCRNRRSTRCARG